MQMYPRVCLVSAITKLAHSIPWILVIVHECENLSSGLQEALHWPKMVSGRSNRIAFKPQNFFWSMPRPDIPLALACLHTKNLTTPNLMAVALCAQFETWSVYINSCCYDNVNYEMKLMKGPCNTYASNHDWSSVERNTILLFTQCRVWETVLQEQKLHQGKLQ